MPRDPRSKGLVQQTTAEAELTGLCRGGAQALGLQSPCRDLDLDLKIRLHPDRTTALGVCEGRGLGKVCTWQSPACGCMTWWRVRTCPCTKSWA